jgi:hypothetical protein
MLVIDCIQILGRFVDLGTEVFAESLASGDGLSEVEMDNVWN